MILADLPLLLTSKSVSWPSCLRDANSGGVLQAPKTSKRFGSFRSLKRNKALRIITPVPIATVPIATTTQFVLRSEMCAIDQVSSHPFRADRFIGDFPGLPPRS